jgi:hypothetical protein
MPRKARPPANQLTLCLTPATETSVFKAEPPALLQALADLLLAALGPNGAAPATSPVIQESGDEPQDHA